MRLETQYPERSATVGSQPLIDAEGAARPGLRAPTLRPWRAQGRGPAYIRHGGAIRSNLPVVHFLYVAGADEVPFRRKSQDSESRYSGSWLAGALPHRSSSHHALTRRGPTHARIESLDQTRSRHRSFLNRSSVSPKPMPQFPCVISRQSSRRKIRRSGICSTNVSNLVTEQRSQLSQPR
jgi:hypothetical protein